MGATAAQSDQGSTTCLFEVHHMLLVGFQAVVRTPSPSVSVEAEV